MASVHLGATGANNAPSAPSRERDTATTLCTQPHGTAWVPTEAAGELQVGIGTGVDAGVMGTSVTARAGSSQSTTAHVTSEDGSENERCFIRVQSSAILLCYQWPLVGRDPGAHYSYCTQAQHIFKTARANDQLWKLKTKHGRVPAACEALQLLIHS